MRNKNSSRFSRPCTPAHIEPLERRQLLNAAILKGGTLTVYCTDNSNVDITNDGGDTITPYIVVNFENTLTPRILRFHGASTARMRVIADGNFVALDQTYTPNLTDVTITQGSIGGTLVDDTRQHKFNRNERVSIFGGSGNDYLTGGPHTVLIDGGAGNDTISGGEAGATLDGGDGDDLLSVNDTNAQVGLFNDLTESRSALDGGSDFHDPLGGVVLNGGAGDDVLIGNYPKTAGITDTLSGGSDNDTFYPFATDQLVDFGVGSDQNLSANQFVGNAQAIQTATLKLDLGFDEGSSLQAPPLNLGNNGPNSRIFVSDSNGTLTMQGPAGSTFTLGELFNAAGDPFARTAVPSIVTLRVNGVVSQLRGNQIAGYQINDGDSIVLAFSLG
jgi:Ca2+-binding RTX toxin-like protein